MSKYCKEFAKVCPMKHLRIVELKNKLHRYAYKLERQRIESSKLRTEIKGILSFLWKKA